MSSPEFVYVAIYTHGHGTDVAVYRNVESAYKWREEIATTYWDDFYLDEPMPKENVSEAYFNGMAEIGGDEWFTVERRQVEEVA